MNPNDVGSGPMFPEWTLADRLEKSLHIQKITVTEMANFFGVHRNTVSGWINGRTTPAAHAVKLWALRTGVSYTWLHDGHNNNNNNNNDGHQPGVLIARIDGNDGEAPRQLTFIFDHASAAA